MQPTLNKSKMLSKQEDPIKELKGFEFDLADSRDAYKFDEVVRKIGEHVGRVHGKDMKDLVVSSKEKSFKKPVYPIGDKATDESKAIWSKEYDR